MRRQAFHAALSLMAIAGAAFVLRVSSTENSTTIALSLLLVVLFVAATAELWTAVLTAIVAMVCFNFFFLPPIGTLTLADPSNWIALLAFLVVATVASHLSASVRARAKDATDRRIEVIRLLDLSRDILLTTDQPGALDAIARAVARRFDLDLVAICVLTSAAWQVHYGSVSAPEIPASELDAALAGASGAIEFDARTRTYGGHRTIETPAGPMTLAPIRLGTRTIGLLAGAAGRLEPGARDAIAGIVAIALERLQFLGERHAADLVRQRAELSSALLASLSHDLKTPLTAIRTAISNLDSADLPPGQRQEQARVASGQLERLTQLFDEILDMARIEAGGVQVQRRWTTPAELVDAAVAHAASILEARDVRIDAHDDTAVDLDPRLTASAVAYLVENAARYAPSGPIEIRGWTDVEGVRIDVRDFGPGLQPAELDRLFEPFYRGEAYRQAVPGTGMGLAITRGLLAAQGGRIWGENAPGGGARFSLHVPGAVRAVEADIKS